MQGGWNPQGPGGPGGPPPPQGFGPATQAQPFVPPPSQPTQGFGAPPPPPPPQGFGAPPPPAPGFGAAPPAAQGFAPTGFAPVVPANFAPATVTATTGPQKGFVGALFDFSFTSFVTTKMLKFLYGLCMVAIVLAFLGAVVTSLQGITSSYSYRKEQALVILLASPFAAVLTLIYVRMLFEMIVVAFRIAENLSEINRKTRE